MTINGVINYCVPLLGHAVYLINYEN